MTLNIYCDGGARGNPGPAVAAFVVYEGDPSTRSARSGLPAANMRAKRGKPFDRLRASSFDYAQDKFAQGKYLGVRTNNEAEYEAVVEALEWTRRELGELGGAGEVKEIKFFLDSDLVVNQLNGLFKVKNGRLRELLFKVRALEQELSPVAISYSYVPREKNWRADALVNETLDRHSTMGEWQR